MAHPTVPSSYCPRRRGAEAQAALRAGAAGFIPKSANSKVMLQAIRLFLAGGQYLPPQLMICSNRRVGVGSDTD
jgi:DNA-binding NarL/FixJ family response regulator